ncbi:MAG: hypothetical protein ACMVO3_00055 [Thalassobaculum sp.]
MAIFGMGVVLGPVSSTNRQLSVEVYDWHWVLFMIVPCGLAALSRGADLHPGPFQGGVDLDWTGF